MANRGKSGQSQGNRLSDRDILLDLLTTEKHMSHLYDHAIMEATGDNVRDLFIALQQDEHESAQMFFDFMQQQGWYTTGAGRQQGGRRLQSGQRLSGGMQPTESSRYAVTSGARDFGQAMRQGRGQGGRQPQGGQSWQPQGSHHSQNFPDVPTWQPQGGQRGFNNQSGQGGWQPQHGQHSQNFHSGQQRGQNRNPALAGRSDQNRNF